LFFRRQKRPKRDISLSRDNSLSPTKGKGPFSATSSPTIIFLTTNRVESLDPAFKSRIHHSIAYPPFSTGSRLQLWKTFISHGSPKGARCKWLDEKFHKRILKEEVNGRQIKNVVSMAYTRSNNGRRLPAANDIILSLNAPTTFEFDFNQKTGKSLQKEKVEGTEDSPSKRRKVA
jgi:hypothetical protein